MTCAPSIRAWPRLAALVAAQPRRRGVIAGVDGGAAGEQGHRLRRAAAIGRHAGPVIVVVPVVSASVIMNPLGGSAPRSRFPSSCSCDTYPQPPSPPLQHVEG